MTKLLILSPNQATRWNPAHQQLRDAIAGFSGYNTIQVGTGFHGQKKDRQWEIHDVCRQYGVPDVLATYGLRYTYQYQGLGRVQDIPKIHFICDLLTATGKHQGNIEHYRRLILRDKYDFFVAHNLRVIHWLREQGFGNDWNCLWLPFGVDTDKFNIKYDRRPVDVMTTWSLHDEIYPGRSQINKKVNEKYGSKAHIRRVFGGTFANALASSKIALNTTSLFKVFNTKILEAMASGCCLLTEKWADFDMMPDFVDGENVVLWDGIDDLMDKIDYYLTHHGERIAIAGKAVRTVAAGHTNIHRAMRFREVVDQWISQ